MVYPLSLYEIEKLEYVSINNAKVGDWLIGYIINPNCRGLKDGIAFNLIQVGAIGVDNILTPRGKEYTFNYSDVIETATGIEYLIPLEIEFEDVKEALIKDAKRWLVLGVIGDCRQAMDLSYTDISSLSEEGLDKLHKSAILLKEAIKDAMPFG